MAAVLRDQGVDSEYVSLEDIVPISDTEDYTAGSLGQDFYDRLSVALGERIQQCGRRVPVVTGTQLIQTYSFPSHTISQDSSGQFLVPFWHKLGAVTQISFQLFWLLVCTLQSSRSGRKSMEFSPQTLEKLSLLASYP